MHHLIEIVYQFLNQHLRDFVQFIEMSAVHIEHKNN